MKKLVLVLFVAASFTFVSTSCSQQTGCPTFSKEMEFNKDLRVDQASALLTNEMECNN